MTILALIIGLAVVLQGLLGLFSPDTFVSLIRFFQAPPVVYVAAVIRVAVGVVLFVASSRSRAPVLLRLLGVLITVGGVLTPFVGIQGADAILRWWSSRGPQFVRLWAVIALAIGAFIVFAVRPRPRTA